MKPYLPYSTKPWEQRVERRHKPKARSFSAFRPCLRWEFGFYCAVCLIHEVDLMPGGVEGWGVTHTEHFEPQSRGGLKDDYDNCIYLCRLCNISRGATRNEGDEGLLLNPCSVTWANHFDRVEDEIVPKTGDANATYTMESYDLNDPRKVSLRYKRRERMCILVNRYDRCGAKQEQLLDLATQAAGSLRDEEILKLVDNAVEHRAMQEEALGELARYRPVPTDPAPSCSCGRTDHHNLAEVFASQTADLNDLRKQARAHCPPP